MNIVSVHIPKVGGLSFAKHLKSLFGSRLFLDYSDTDRPEYKPKPIPPYLLAQLRKQKTTVIHGHLFLSRYHNIPALQRVMWFRDPVERLLSHYYYWLRASDMDHPNCIKLHEGGLSVAEFAALPELRNIFTRFLDGVQLGELNYVGILEDYQASLDLFYAMYAVGKDPKAVTAHINKNPGQPKAAYKIKQSLRSTIEGLNQHDMELYEAAKVKFDGLVIRYGRGY